MKTTIIASILVAFLAGCATNSPDVISPRDAQQLRAFSDAVVVSVRPVTIDGSQTGIGAVAGGAVGVAATRGVSRGSENLAIGIISGIAGAALGNAIERASTQQAAEEIILRKPNGAEFSIIQSVGNEKLKPGDPVYLVQSGSRTRVIKAR